ncbi:MAG: hypothetical protein AB8H79_03525 [Myxococcota bacterium]
MSEPRIAHRPAWAAASVVGITITAALYITICVVEHRWGTFMSINGASGLLSRLLVSIPVGGTSFLVVGTFIDDAMGLAVLDRVRWVLPPLLAVFATLALALLQ